MNKIQNWTSFSNCIQFGQSFAATAIAKEQNQSKKEEKISFYLQKFIVSIECAFLLQIYRPTGKAGYEIRGHP